MDNGNHNVPRRVRFGSFELDLETGELWNDGAATKVQPQPAKLLAMLARHPGELLTREQIQEKLWGSTVVDFDQGLNSAVRQIRSVLGDSAEAPAFIETIPRRGYRFLPAVEPVAERIPVVGRPSRQRTAWVAALLLATGATVAWLSLRDLARVEAPERIRLAVLPFENLSDDPQQEFFSDGLTEELITELSRVDPHRLGVVARTSAMRYKTRDKSIDQIREELDVDYVLEGSVRRGERGFRITAQLITTKDQTHLWADSYDRPFKDALELQREVTGRVTRSLVPELFPKAQSELARRAPRDPAAREAYLKGRYFLHRKKPDSPEKALGFFREATDIDPLYAEAHVGQAEAWMMMPPRRDGRGKARQAVDMALQLEPDLAEAHLALGNLRLYTDWDWPGARNEFERAVTDAPGLAMAYFAYASYFSTIGDHEAALVQARRALELDPVSSSVTGELAWIYFYARQFDRSLVHARKALELEPEDAWALSCVLHASVQAGRYQEAVAPAQTLMRQKGANQADLDLIARGDPRDGLNAYYEWNLKYFRDRVERGDAAPMALALMHIRLGQHEETLTWLHKAYEARSGVLAYLAVEPRMDPLRTDPRFMELLQRIGLPKVPQG